MNKKEEKQGNLKYLRMIKGYEACSDKVILESWLKYLKTLSSYKKKGEVWSDEGILEDWMTKHTTVMRDIVNDATFMNLIKDVCVIEKVNV